MEWLFPAAVFLWGVYLVWKIDKLEGQVKELRSVPFRLQRDAVNALEQRLDQLKQCFDQLEQCFVQLDAIVDRRLYALEQRLDQLEYPPLTPAQRDSLLQLIDETIAEGQKLADLTRP